MGGKHIGKRKALKRQVARDHRFRVQDLAWVNGELWHTPSGIVVSGVPAVYRPERPREMESEHSRQSVRSAHEESRAFLRMFEELVNE